MSENNKKQTVEEWLAAGNQIKTVPTKTPLDVIAELKPKYAALIGCKVISRRCCPDGNGRVWAMSQKGA